VLQVHQQLVDGELGAPKTENSLRTLPLSGQTTAALDEMRQRSTPGVPWIFVTDTGGPMSRRNVHRSWRAAVRDAGLPYIKLHGTRHTFVTTAIARGTSPNVVAAYIGDTVATMQSVYWDALPTHTEALATVMDSVYGETK
jgi:integrase